MRERIAVSTVRHSGGPCRHCRTWMRYADTMVKLTDCCDAHPPTAQGTKNGKGVWVCLACADTLVPVITQEGLWS